VSPPQQQDVTMTTQTSRKALHAYVSHEAHEQWHGFAADQGVSVSAVLEALAPAIGNEPESTEIRLIELDAIVTDARRIDAARRRRSQ
jgi:hypothetical protein